MCYLGHEENHTHQYARSAQRVYYDYRDVVFYFISFVQDISIHSTVENQRENRANVISGYFKDNFFFRYFKVRFNNCATTTSTIALTHVKSW